MAMAFPCTGMDCYRRLLGCRRSVDHSGECGGRRLANCLYPAVVDHVLVALVRAARKALDSPRRMAAGSAAHTASFVRGIAVSLG